MIRHCFILSLLKLKTIRTEGCLTDYGRGPPCHFPYKLEGQIYFSCTTKALNSESFTKLPPHCPTKVDNITLEASKLEEDWGECGKSCPLRSYQDNQQLQDSLENLAKQNPETAQTFDLGKSVRGLALFGIRISSGVDKPRKVLKPSVYLIANMHGNEVVGRELLTHLAVVLLKGREHDERIRSLLDNVEVHIVPTMNPDGWLRSEEGNCGGQDYYSGRLNSNRVDLNRNFPVSEVGVMKSSQHDQEPETLAVMKWLGGHNFVLGANFHGGAIVASYPWDHSLVPMIFLLQCT